MLSLIRQHSRVTASPRRAIGLCVVLLLGLAPPAFAVAKDKAMYVGGTLRDFPKGGLGSRLRPTIFGVEVSTVEGRCNTRSPSEFVFEAGSDTLTIPYGAVTRLTYGLTLPDRPHGGGGVLLITWNPLDQFTSKAHYMLWVAFRDQSGADQNAAFELGRDIVKPVLGAFEARTGKPIEFMEVGACLRYKSADQCNYGTPVELKGLMKVFVDAGPDPAFRTLIVSEIEKCQLHLEMLTATDGAEIVLRFYGDEIRSPEAFQAFHGGRGEVFVARDGRLRPVMAFAGTRTGAWGAKPASKFGEAFCESYRQANGR